MILLKAHIKLSIFKNIYFDNFFNFQNNIIKNRWLNMYLKTHVNWPILRIDGQEKEEWKQSLTHKYRERKRKK